MEAGSSRLQQETEPEEAAQETSPPADFTCSKETNHENMSQLGQVEQNKDRQEMSEAAASCEEPSGKWNSDSSAAPHTGSQLVSEIGWELSCGVQTWGRCCCQGHGQSWNI